MILQERLLAAAVLWQCALSVRQDIQEFSQFADSRVMQAGGAVVDDPDAKETTSANVNSPPFCHVAGWYWENVQFGKAPHKRFAKLEFTYNVSCSADASLKMFFSGLTQKEADTAGIGGIYKEFNLTKGLHQLDPMEITLIDKNFGVKPGFQWIHIEASNHHGSETHEYYQEVKQVEGIEGRLWFAGTNAKDGCLLSRWTQTYGPRGSKVLERYKLQVWIQCTKRRDVEVFFSSPLKNLDSPTQEPGGVTGVWKKQAIKDGNVTSLELVDLLALNTDLKYGIASQTMWISIRADGNIETNDYIQVQEVPGNRTLKNS